MTAPETSPFQRLTRPCRRDEFIAPMTGLKTTFAAAALGSALVLAGGSAPDSAIRWLGLGGASSNGHSLSNDAVIARSAVSATDRSVSAAAMDGNDVIEEYCVRCHSERRLRGNLSLEGFDADNPEAMGEVAEKMIVKLRAGMMPPPGVSRPEGDTLEVLVAALEDRLDAVAERRPNPGSRTFQRLNQAEYAASVRSLLGLEIDGADYLPPDTKSANFDNIADVQMLSPTLLDAYLNAAAEVSRLAVGDPSATSTETQYRVPRWASQTERVQGAPCW